MLVLLPQAAQPSSQLNNANRSPSDNSLEDPNPKWDINLSSKPLIQTQSSVLAKGSNFVVTPRHPPNLEYIMAIESLCTTLGQQDAEECRAEIHRVLRSFHQPKSNLTRAQSQAIRELKRDRDCIVLTTEKGVPMCAIPYLKFTLICYAKMEIHIDRVKKHQIIINQSGIRIQKAWIIDKLSHHAITQSQARETRYAIPTYYAQPSYPSMQLTNQKPGKPDILSQHAVEAIHRSGNLGMLSQHTQCRHTILA